MWLSCGYGLALCTMNFILKKSMCANSSHCWHDRSFYLFFSSSFILGCNISSTNQFIPVHSKILDRDLGTSMTSVVSNSRSKVHNRNSQIIVNQKNIWLGRATGNVTFFLPKRQGSPLPIFFFFSLIRKTGEYNCTKTTGNRKVQGIQAQREKTNHAWVNNVNVVQTTQVIMKMYNERK